MGFNTHGVDLDIRGHGALLSLLRDFLLEYRRSNDLKQYEIDLRKEELIRRIEEDRI